MTFVWSLIDSFVAAFTAIFAISNPVGCALIYARLAADHPAPTRRRLARSIAVNAAVVLVVATWAGGALMRLFGVGMDALRVAGGLVVATQAWNLLQERADDDTGHDARAIDPSADALFPLTIPFTTGPGTIAVATAIGIGSPAALVDFVPFFAGVTLAAAAITVSIAVLYGSADRVLSLLGPSGARAVTRLSSFLLLCIGVQMMMAGVRNVVYWVL